MNTLATVNTDTTVVSGLVSDPKYQFYTSPLISPDGNHISFVRWCNPNMPWDGAETCIASITSDGKSIQIKDDIKRIAGNSVPTLTGAYNSSQQPEWLSNDKILLLADKSGFLIPYIYTLSKDELKPALTNTPNEDFGDPAWNLGNRSYAIIGGSSKVLFSSIRAEENKATLYLADLDKGTYVDLETPYVEISKIRYSKLLDKFIFIGLKGDEAQSLVQLTVTGDKYDYVTLKTTSSISDHVPKEYISVGKSLTVPVGGKSVQCTYYPPQNPNYQGKKDEKPPCIVTVHGGPTGRDGTGLVWTVQYFTTRGFAW